MLERTLRVLPISLKARCQELGLLRKRERLGQPYDESLRLRLARLPMLNHRSCEVGIVRKSRH